MSRQLNIEATELRGVGIQLSRLESVNANKTAAYAIDRFLRPVTEITNEVQKDKLINALSTLTPQKYEISKTSSTAIDNFFVVKKHVPNLSKQSSKMKTIKATEIDGEVLEALPEDIRQEVIKVYGLKENYVNGQSTEKRPKEPDKPVLYNRGLNYSQVKYFGYIIYLVCNC